MNKSDHYQTDHIIAKALVCLAVIALGAISVEISNPYVVIFVDEASNNLNQQIKKGRP